MWSLFIVGPAIASLTSTIVSLTGGAKFVAAAITAEQWHRQKGYRPGEGHLTRRAVGGNYGVRFDENSPYNINRVLGSLKKISLFNELKTMKFDMTESEENLLRAMLLPVEAAMKDMEAALSGDIDTELLEEVSKRLMEVILPVKTWLQDFPRKAAL